jgi:hypothetical protein
MSIPKRVFSSLAFLCLTLTTIHATTTTEHLYTLGGPNGNTLKTYSVSKTNALAKKLGTTVLPAKYLIQVFRAPIAPFLYVLGFLYDGSEHIWTYKVNASGVPIGIQYRT